MEKILAIDTAGDSCSAALTARGQLLKRYEPRPREHSELLLPMVDSLLTEGNLKLSDLKGIAYIRGPGSFTGLRIGVSVVQGLAYAANLPTLGLSSLQVLAMKWLESHSLSAAQTLLVMLDARMSEVYWGQYQIEGSCPVLMGEESVSSPESVLLGDEAESDLIAVGAGCCYQSKMSDAIQSRLKIVNTEITTCAVDIFSLLKVQDNSAASFDYSCLAEPVYLRTEIAWKKLSEQKKRNVVKTEVKP
tara:strand:+ start:144 stop:884 length:741 start_codon:yes stop_codon:yes gene_type:complete